MVISFVTYIKNRRIGSTYPSIDAKPDSQAKKTLRKLRESIAQKCIAIMNAMPFISPRVSTGLINIIELQGMFELFFVMRKPFTKRYQIGFSCFLPWNLVLKGTVRPIRWSCTSIDTFLAISNALKSTTYFNFEPLVTLFCITTFSNSWICQAQLFKIQFQLTDCYIYIANSWNFIACFRSTSSILRCELMKWVDPRKLRRSNKRMHDNYNNLKVIKNSFWTDTLQNKVLFQST